MAVHEALSEEECYLYAILSDESGLDQAEFAYTDETTKEGVFRAWPFQWPWWRCEDEKQIDQGSRSCGKSLSIKFRAFAFPFVAPGEEMVITAPEGVHLDAVTDNVETLYSNNRLAREMIAKGRGGIKHRPFMINFANGARIMGRIPQRDGKGMKGTHPLWLEQDEASDYPEPGWIEVIETVKQGNEKARWRAHGVTRGIGGTFDDYCKPDSGWRVHRLPAMYRPTWNENERAEKVRQYGHQDNVDYRRNILGLPGDQNSPIFVLYRLMENVDTDQSSDYNTRDYTLLEIDESMLRDGVDIAQFIDLPGSHNKYRNFWIGMDVGWTIAPSAIVVFAEEKLPKSTKTQLKLLARIMLKRVATEDQAKAIIHLISLYRPLAFAMDSTGAGFPLLQNVQQKAREIEDLAPIVNRIKGYNFSEKIIADFDDNIEIDDQDPEAYKEAAIKRNVLEWSTDVLRSLVDDKRLILPWDRQLIGEFQGQTWSFAKSALDPYGRKKIYSMGTFHTLDACRMAALAYQQNAIEQFIKNQEDTWTPPPMVFL